MKVTIDIECSPEEARTFLGLPDLGEIQQTVIQTVQENIAEHLKNMDPEALMKTWLPTGLGAWENMQEAFMAQFSGARSSSDKSKK